MKNVKVWTLLIGLFLSQEAICQSVFSPSVNGLRSRYQTRLATNTHRVAGQERGAFVFTCSHDACTADGWQSKLFSPIAESTAKTQDLTIREQL